jgi:hypothetical protein
LKPVHTGLVLVKNSKASDLERKLPEKNGYWMLQEVIAISWYDVFATLIVYYESERT